MTSGDCSGLFVEGAYHPLEAKQVEAEQEPFGTLSLGRIRRILNDSRDARERAEAIRQLLPRLWDSLPWQRYQAGCVLTTRVYLPSPLFLVEWGSFPNVLTRRLRRNHYTALPTTLEAQRSALADTLGKMLAGWLSRYKQSKPNRSARGSENPDIVADACEAVGRMGIVELEADLLDVLRYLRMESNQVRSAALLALAALPPEGLTETWRLLRTGNPQERRLVGSALAYMVLPGAVPFLLEALPEIAASKELQYPVGIPLLMALGRIGDPRALPDLNHLARTENHPLQPSARNAIQRIMKEAEGQEEVTLLRASAVNTLYEDTLLRASSSQSANTPPEELLRAAVKAPPEAEKPSIEKSDIENSAIAKPE